MGCDEKREECSKFIYKQWEQIYISVGKSVIDHLGYGWYIQGCTNDINSILLSMKLWRVSLCP
ncbi:hypothetical protein T03_7075 [Trichinella britovi]|uniref:Uncharacterized protein n=1 Tax=Trichinella britovi TaxID=45882 RepID=A0A0V1AT01_TRIBR|nr:hypothetical protein T03_9158 [Trichinella britovi]KRY28315.1 hypothetical protein T03_15034 [Trichinella britovi]KRY28333.1 hypothetical protein T03_7075 [Trichinella britovi]